MTHHKIKTPTKPARKPLPMCGCINKQTRKATTAMLHQGKNIPVRKLSATINKKDNKNLIKE
jgi:hypothetical protein